jgi:hypothetical protein
LILKFIKIKKRNPTYFCCKSRWTFYF